MKKPVKIIKECNSIIKQQRERERERTMKGGSSLIIGMIGIILLIVCNGQNKLQRKNDCRNFNTTTHTCPKMTKTESKHNIIYSLEQTNENDVWTHDIYYVRAKLQITSDEGWLNVSHRCFINFILFYWVLGVQDRPELQPQYESMGLIGVNFLYCVIICSFYWVQNFLNNKVKSFIRSSLN